MSERVARRRISFLLATTFIISTAPFGIAAMANDETPPAARDDGAKAKPLSPAARGANAQAQQQAIQLDTITVQTKKRARQRTAPAAAPVAPPPAAPVVTTNAGGDIGYHANSTSTATKTNTPLRDIPQSVTVITKQQVQDIGAQRIEDVGALRPGRQLAPGRRQPRPDRHPRPELDRRLLRQRHARRRADLSRSLQHRTAGVSQRAERDDLRPRRRRRRVEPRAQGSRWRSDQRVEGPDRFLQQRARVRRRRRQDHRQRLRPDQRRVRGHRHLSRLHPYAARRRQSDADLAGRSAHQGEALVRIFPRRPDRGPRHPVVQRAVRIPAPSPISSSAIRR